jgi:lysophospholipase L1-like esterase
MTRTLRLALLAVAVLVATAAAPWTARPADAPAWPDPQRFAADVAAFVRADSASPPPAGAIVCVGSSSMRFWHPTIAADLAPLAVVPRGFGGSTAHDVVAWLEPLVLAPRPRAVLLYEGDNDIEAGLDPQTVAAEFDTLIARTRAALPGTRFYVLSVKPSPARWALWPRMAETNVLLRQRCAADSLSRYVDVATPMLDPAGGRPRPALFLPDSLHMTPAGYAVWTRVVRAALLPREAAGDGGR